MNVDFMRLVDRWLGVPLCFMLSAIAAAARVGRKQAQPKAVDKILFMQISEMGSAISAYSALRKTQLLFPQADLYYFIFEEMQESIKLLGIIPDDHILTVSSKTPLRFLRGALRLIRTVRRFRLDAVVDLELFSRVSAIVGYLSGARVRVGFHRFHMEGLYRGSLLTHRVIYNHLNHISLNYLALVYALQQPESREPLTKLPLQEDDIIRARLFPSKEDRQRMLAKLQQSCSDIRADKRIVLLNPNGSNLLPLRRWPVERYIELARRLLANTDVFIIVTGARSEGKDAAAICDSVQSRRCVNFAGQTTLRELIDLYAISTVMVSNDSGPPNFASLTDLPVLVFFGPETPKCYRPLSDRVEVLYADYFCSPCVSAYNHRKSACTDNKCVQAISVDAVCERLKALVPGLIA